MKLSTSGTLVLEWGRAGTIAFFFLCIDLFFLVRFSLFTVRSAFKNAVSSLFDACPSVPSQTLFPGAAEEDEPSAEHADMGALVSLLPHKMAFLLLIESHHQ